MARRRSGTSIKKSWDVKRLGRALAAQGLDLRHWVSYGTVASVSGEDGAANYGDDNAILITPAGVEVDVILEPSKYPVTCRYGVQAGQVYICTPIHPGDQVQVIIPEGDVSMVPEIVRIITGSSDPMPTEEDGSPVFKNDRALIAARDVPIELRTMGGVSLLVNPDGTIQLGAGATEQLPKGTTYRNAEAQMNKLLADPTTGAIATLNTAAQGMTPSDLTALGIVAPTVATFLAAFKVFSPLWLAAISGFEAGASGFLSDVSKTK